MATLLRTTSRRFHVHFSRRNYASQADISPSSRLKSYAYSATVLAGLGLFTVYYLDSRSAIHRYFFPPLLRKTLDAEKGHKFAVRVLRNSLLAPRDVVKDDTKLRVEVWGKVLDNPVGLAAGFDKDGEAIDALFGLGFGVVEIGSVTPNPQPGNGTPRVFHLAEDRAVINRYGFPSKGASALLTRLQARFSSSKSNVEGASLLKNKLLSINLGKNKSSPPDSISDFLLGVKMFGPLSDILVINVSSPNTPGLRNLQSRGMLTELLSAVRQERDALGLGKKGPKLLVKVAPDLGKEELEDVAEAVRLARVDGVIVGNTTVQRPESLASSNKSELGGLSGPPLKPLTLQAIRTLRPLLPKQIILIGCGGISSGTDAIEYAKSGATFVQLYTSFAYDGVGAVRRIKDEIGKEGGSWMDYVREGERKALRSVE